MSSKPDRPCRCAFFDVDGTLIRIKSMVSFLEFLRDLPTPTLTVDVPAYLQHFERMNTDGMPREDINRFYYTAFAGLPADMLQLRAAQWYDAVVVGHDLFFPRMLEEVARHQWDGTQVVLVSGSFAVLLQPLARQLHVTEVIAAPLEVIDGCYTGRLYAAPTIGRGKAERIDAYMQQHGAGAAGCYAYGDDISDVPMLEMVGEPTAVNPNAPLRRLCERRRWNVIDTVAPPQPTRRPAHRAVSKG